MLMFSSPLAPKRTVRGSNHGIAWDYKEVPPVAVSLRHKRAVLECSRSGFPSTIIP